MFNWRTKGNRRERYKRNFKRYPKNRFLTANPFKFLKNLVEKITNTIIEIQIIT